MIQMFSNVTDDNFHFRAFIECVVKLLNSAMDDIPMQGVHSETLTVKRIV